MINLNIISEPGRTCKHKLFRTDRLIITMKMHKRQQQQLERESIIIKSCLIQSCVVIKVVCVDC